MKESSPVRNSLAWAIRKRIYDDFDQGETFTTREFMDLPPLYGRPISDIAIKLSVLVKSKMVQACGERRSAEGSVNRFRKYKIDDKKALVYSLDKIPSDIKQNDHDMYTNTCQLNLQAILDNMIRSRLRASE